MIREIAAVVFTPEEVKEKWDELWGLVKPLENIALTTKPNSVHNDIRILSFKVKPVFRDWENNKKAESWLDKERIERMHAQDLRSAALWGRKIQELLDRAKEILE